MPAYSADVTTKYQDLVETLQGNLVTVKSRVDFAVKLRDALVVGHGWPEDLCSWGEVAPFEGGRMLPQGFFAISAQGEVRCELVLGVVLPNGFRAAPIRLPLLVATSGGLLYGAFLARGSGMDVTSETPDAELPEKLVALLDGFFRGQLAKRF